MESLRERASRSRRLAKDSADNSARADLTAYADELDARANRMQAQLERGAGPRDGQKR